MTFADFAMTERVDFLFDGADEVDMVVDIGMIRSGNWRATEKAPDMTACEAMTGAAVARMTIGISAQSGAIMKIGFFTAAGLASSSWPLPLAVPSARRRSSRAARCARA